MTRFPNQVDDRPVLFTLLQMIQGQSGQLSLLWGVTVITNLLVPDIVRCVIVGTSREFFESGSTNPDHRLLATDRVASVQCNSSSSGKSTTLSCSLGSVRAITAVQVSVWLEL